MRKIFILAAVLLILSFPVGASAEDVTAETQAYAETVIETAAETAETATEAVETETDELSAMLDVATPEQIELVKQYMLYGIKSLPVSERVKLFLLEHLNALMWVVAAAALLIFSVSNRLTSKKHTDEAATMTNNAIELAEIGQKYIADAQKEMHGIKIQCAEMLEQVRSDLDNRMEKNDKNMAEFMENAVNRLDRILQSANNAMRDASEREQALTEALLLNEEITAYMIENSALPEVERDRMTTISNKISEQLKALEKEVRENEVRENAEA